MRRYHRTPAMLRRILFYLLALALLHASPGFHWHGHSHEAVHTSASAASHGADAHPDHPDETGEESRCTECLLQALQAAPAGDGSAALSAVLGVGVALAFDPSQERPQSPPAGRIRVRGPPAITA
jgi:hypothetical protein